MENPTKLDDLGIPPFQENSIWRPVDRWIPVDRKGRRNDMGSDEVNTVDRAALELENRAHSGSEGLWKAKKWSRCLGQSTGWVVTTVIF